MMRTASATMGHGHEMVRSAGREMGEERNQKVHKDGNMNENEFAQEQENRENTTAAEIGTGVSP